MDNKSKQKIFQIVLMSVFGLGVIIALGIFALNKGTTTSNDPTVLAGNLTVWGTLPYRDIKGLLDGLSTTHKDLRVTYTEKKTKTYDTELVNAFASGIGPDIFMITPETIMKQRSRLLTIPYTSFPQKTFKETFADQVRLFMLSDGIVGFPMLIDPLVMYVNRDILSDNFIVSPPKTWESLIEMNSALTKKTPTGALQSSMIALGTADNITHISEIITTLILQTGDPITVIVPQTGEIQLTHKSAEYGNLANSVFDFYTSFSDSTTNQYSWNSGQENDLKLFTAGKLAFYIGLASELPDIAEKNPNLNMDVTYVPILGAGGKKMVYGDMYGWGINKFSKNTNLAVRVLPEMTSNEFINAYTSTHYIAPARRDLLATPPKDDAIKGLIYNSAIISGNFWNPDKSAVTNVLRDTMRSITTGSIDPVTGYNNWISDMSTKLTDIQPK